MSRSIHATHAQIQRERQFDYSCEEARRDKLAPLDAQLHRKRFVKAMSRQSRKAHSIDDVPAIEPGMIPIEIAERGRVIHYPASADDIRAVMERLPRGVFAGLSGIRLCLGSECQESFLSRRELAAAVRDPWTGRISSEYLPGVYGASTRGIYNVDIARIDLHAYVHEEALSAANQLYLRLRVLSTLVHELAHHEDFMRRGARARGGAKLERYAISIQAEWVRECVVPYLEEAYPDAVREVHEWIATHGGAPVPLALLGGRWHWDSQGKVITDPWSSTCDAYEELVRNVREGGDPDSIRLEFAQDLVFADAHTEALAITDRVLGREPQSQPALTLQAEIFLFQEQFDQAERAAERALARNPTNVRAWRVRAGVCVAREDWVQLLDAANAGLDASRGEETAGYYLHVFELLGAHANVALGNLASAREALDRPRPKLHQHRVRAIRALLSEKDVAAASAR